MSVQRPKPEDWPRFVAKLRPLLTEDYDWAQDVAAIQAPTLIVVGDADTVLPRARGGAVWTARRRQGGQRDGQPLECPARRTSGHHAF